MSLFILYSICATYCTLSKKLVQMQKMWALRKPILDAHILSLQEKVRELEQEIDEIVMEHIQALSNINLKANGI